MSQKTGYCGGRGVCGWCSWSNSGSTIKDLKYWGVIGGGDREISSFIYIYIHISFVYSNFFILSYILFIALEIFAVVHVVPGKFAIGKDTDLHPRKSTPKYTI